MQWGSIIFIFTTQIAEFVCRLGYSSGARIKTGDFIREHFLECLIHSTNPQGNGATFKNAVHLLPVTKNEFISHFSPSCAPLIWTQNFPTPPYSPTRLKRLTLTFRKQRSRCDKEISKTFLTVAIKTVIWELIDESGLATLSAVPENLRSELYVW